MVAEKIVKRIAGALIDALEFLAKPFRQAGEKIQEEAIEDVTKGSPAIEDVLKKLYEFVIKKPFTAWYDFVFKPKEFEPDDAFHMSTTFVPIAVGATAAIGAADHIAQMLPFGLDSTAVGIMEDKLWTRLGLASATAATFQSPVRVGLFRSLDYFYNAHFLNKKLDPSQAYDGVRFREFLTEDEWSKFEGVVRTDKPVQEMSPEEIEDWAATAAKAVDGVENINTERFGEEMKYYGYKAGYISLLDRSAKRAPTLMMLRQMAMRGFFDPMFMARSVFKGGFDNWAIKPTLQFLAYMAQEGTWVGYREAAQGAYVKGLITEDELRATLRRIHVPDMLLDPIIATQNLKIGHDDRGLTTTQILRSYTQGVISREECLQDLRDIDYSENIAERLVKTEETRVLPKPRVPTLAQYSRALREGIINEEDFKAYLEKRGYSAEYTSLLMQIERAKYPIIKPKLTLSKFSRAFREGVIDEGTLSNKLKALGYSLEEINLVKTLETTEIKAPTARISKAEILKALGLNVIDFYEATEKLQGLGYSIDDIEILYSIYAKKTKEIIP